MKELAQNKDLTSLVDFSPDPDHLGSLAFSPADPLSARTMRADQVPQFNRDGFISPIESFDAAEALWTHGLFHRNASKSATNVRGGEQWA